MIIEGAKSWFDYTLSQLSFVHSTTALLYQLLLHVYDTFSILREMLKLVQVAPKREWACLKSITVWFTLLCAFLLPNTRHSGVLCPLHTNISFQEILVNWISEENFYYNFIADGYSIKGKHSCMYVRRVFEKYVRCSR